MKRASVRILCAVEVEVADGSTRGNGSLIDASLTGLKIGYLDENLAHRVAMGDLLALRGHMPTGEFVVRGRIERLDRTVGEIGLSIVGEVPATLLELLAAPIAGSGSRQAGEG